MRRQLNTREGEQAMTDFQKVQEQIKDAQAKATSRAKEFEAEARKAYKSLSEKAQVELKALVTQAEEVSREGLAILGAELVRLGKRLQEIGKAEAKAAEPKDEPKADEPHAQA
jgi:hypothetical protein